MKGYTPLQRAELCIIVALARRGENSRARSNVSKALARLSSSNGLTKVRSIRQLVDALIAARKVARALSARNAQCWQLTDSVFAELCGACHTALSSSTDQRVALCLSSSLLMRKSDSSLFNSAFGRLAFVQRGFQQKTDCANTNAAKPSTELQNPAQYQQKR